MVVYTADFGNYDNIHNGADVRYNENNDPYGGNKQLSPKMRAKMYKVLNPGRHELWVDSSIELTDKKGLLKLFDGCELGLIRHPHRDTVEQEAATCVELGLIDRGYTHLVFDDLYFTDKRLYAGCVIYRHPYSQDEFNNAWWSMICQYSDRDQLTLPKAIDMCARRPTVLDIDIYDNPYFRIHPHKPIADLGRNARRFNLR